MTKEQLDLVEKKRDREKVITRERERERLSRNHAEKEIQRDRWKDDDRDFTRDPDSEQFQVTEISSKT